MADGIPITPGSGTTIATDEVGGVHYQRVKPSFGIDGVATDVSATDPLPVTIISGGGSGGLTNTELRASPVPVSGSFYQATQPVSGTFWQATQPVSGTVAVSGSVAVTGTFYQATQPVSGTVAATQSGTWNIGSITTLPALVAGTALIGKVGLDQTTPGTTNAVSVAQIGSTTVASGNGVVSAGVQRVAIASDNTAFAVNSTLQTGANVIGALTANQSVNVAQMNGVTVTMGSGVTGTGVQRVVLATDVALPTGANIIGALSANQTVNNAQINGITPLMGNGVTGTGSQRVTIASDNTAFTVNTTPTTPTASIINSAATTNATSIKASAGTLHSITCSNAGAAAAFVKLYNLAVSPTVGTSVIVLTIPIAASGVVNLTFGATGMRFGTGIALAITNLVGEADATAVAAAQVKVLTSYI